MALFWLYVSFFPGFFQFLLLAFQLLSSFFWLLFCFFCLVFGFFIILTFLRSRPCAHHNQKQTTNIQTKKMVPLYLWRVPGKHSSNDLILGRLPQTNHVSIRLSQAYKSGQMVKSWKQINILVNSFDPQMRCIYI